MTTVHKVNDFEVIKKREGLYAFSNMPFLDEYLSNTTLKFSKNGNKIEIFTETVQSLRQYLEVRRNRSVEDCIKIIYDLGAQILLLERNGEGILFFDLDDIIVINDKFFLFVNTSKIMPIHDDRLSIRSIYDISLFTAPELKAISRLPATAPISVTYYSLALLIIYCLNIDIEILKYSKIYAFLKRCMAPEPEDRVFLFI